MKNFIKSFFKLSDFEFDDKINKITFTVNSQKISGFAGGSNCWESDGNNEDFKDNFYFETDESNEILLSENGLTKIKRIVVKDNLIIFINRNGDDEIFKFKINYFSNKKPNFDKRHNGFIQWQM